MSLVQTYLDNSNYDYYGNAAEDTLVFFVHDENAPNLEETNGKNNTVISDITDDTVNGIEDGLSSVSVAANVETGAEAYQQNDGDA